MQASTLQPVPLNTIKHELVKTMVNYHCSVQLGFFRRQKHEELKRRREELQTLYENGVEPYTTGGGVDYRDASDLASAASAASHSGSTENMLHH